VAVAGAGTLTCTTPAHAPGLVDVVVTNPDSQQGTQANAYTFFADYEADGAPRATGGDGLVDVTDWVQLGRFAAALEIGRAHV